MSIGSSLLSKLAAIAVQKPSPSTSRSISIYDVFLSFRGEDTRKNFTDHLYTALVQAGIHTFRDDNELERGKNIESEIKKAMKESRISIVVLSKNYASSIWCLDELVFVMECTRSAGRIVIPIFYGVDPSQVSELSGGFAEAFVEHEKLFKEEMERVEKWRSALKQVGELGGFVLEGRHEAQFIQNIVNDVRTKLNHKVLNVSPYLVGIDFDVFRINAWLQDETINSKIMIIYGIGGIGKTTIAKIVYNLNCENFQGRSFLANIRQTLEQSNGLLRIQRQLLSDILNKKSNKIFNADEGILKIKKAICCRKVLIVLDDVDQIDQFSAIIGMQKWLFPGSKIIITSRYTSFLNVNYDGSLMLKISELDDDLSTQLLSWHSFGQDHPPEGFEKVSTNLVRYCQGLPLALQVLGSSLYGKSVDVWESELRKLEAVSDGNIQRILKISYDSLLDDHDQNLFLDIACFFVGKKKDYVVKILDDCGFYTTIGLQNLIDRCLITVNEHKQIVMHQLLRDMGREIVRQESPGDPGKRSRVWSHKEAFTVLKENTGTETVKALSFKPVALEGKHDSEDYFRMKGVRLKTEAFAKMQRLKLLELSNTKLEGDCKHFPRSLILLSWHGFPLNSIPTSFYLDKLTVLDMRHSNLKCLWKKTRVLPNLKILNLGHSHFLVMTPNFEGLPNLERLILKDCINLAEIDESIEVLGRIMLLNLKGCKNLNKLPRKISRLKSLEELILSGCLKLKELPKEVAEMNLRVLIVDSFSINQLDSISRDARKPSFLLTKSWYSTFQSRLSPRKGVKLMRFSFDFLPKSLVSLSLANCNISDDRIPRDFSMLPSLQHLNLGCNPLQAIPESINSLTLLHSLILDHCEGLKCLPELPASLKELNINHCTSLERITNLPNLHRKLIFRSLGCEKLDEIEGAFKLQPIRSVDMEMINALGLYKLDSVERFQGKMVNNLTGTSRTTPVQVLHECGIFSIYLPGSEIPGWYNHQCAGSSLSFKVHHIPGWKIIGLNLCVVYAVDRSGVKYNLDTSSVNMKNTTSGLFMSYSPTFFEFPGDNACKLWLSHWRYADQLNDGDEVLVQVHMPKAIQTRRVGVHLVYEEEISKSSQNQSMTYSPWYQILSNADVSVFQHQRMYVLGYNNFSRDVRQLRWDSHCNDLISVNPQLSSVVSLYNKLYSYINDRI